MRLLLIALIGCLSFGVLPPLAYASEAGATYTWQGEWDGHDMTVVVVARGHDPREEVKNDEPWWRWGNTTTDAYLFYWSEDQLVDMILDFSMVDGRPQAALYVPKIVDHRIGVEVFDGSYTRPEELTPDLILSPDAGDWLINGLPNFNLSGRLADPTTGELKWDVRVGAEAPGVPKWWTQTTNVDVREDSGNTRFAGHLRADPSVSFDMVLPLMPSWPYLSVFDREAHHGRIQPLFFSPRTRNLEQNWTGFHIAGMYQVNSIALPPFTNFESPFAFYRFDPAAERYANMVIRTDIWPAMSRFGPPPLFAQRTAIRMSWTGEARNRWRYSLSVTGNHAHKDEVMIGDTAVIAVPYDEYPRWVTSKEWKAATFVEAVDGEHGSEGIYDFSVEDNYPVTEWINGISLTSPADQKVDAKTARDSQPTLEELQGAPVATLKAPYLAFPEVHPLRLDEGFRGEYSLVYNRTPELYFSPIDNRTHLLHAQEGVWNIGDNRVLRVRNGNDDSYIDSWWVERVPKHKSEIMEGVSVASPGTFEEGLFALGDYLLYSSNSTVEFRLLDSEPDNHHIGVPTDERSWRAFLGIADADGLEKRDPSELADWASGLPGESLNISRAKATDVRFTEDGFRFALDLREGFRMEGRDFAGLEELAPGKYLVNFDGGFTVVPLTPVSITADVSATTPIALEPSQLVITLRNEGLQDLTQGELKLLARTKDGEEMVVASRTIDALGETTIAETAQWAPPEAGTWTLDLEITTRTGKTVTLDTETVRVLPPPQLSTVRLFTLSTTLLTQFASILGVVAFALVAGLAWWSQWNPSRKGFNDDV